MLINKKISYLTNQQNHKRILFAALSVFTVLMTLSVLVSIPYAQATHYNDNDYCNDWPEWQWYNFTTECEFDYTVNLTINGITITDNSEGFFIGPHGEFYFDVRVTEDDDITQTLRLPSNGYYSWQEDDYRSLTYPLMNDVTVSGGTSFIFSMAGTEVDDGANDDDDVGTVRFSHHIPYGIDGTTKSLSTEYYTVSYTISIEKIPE